MNRLVRCFAFMLLSAATVIFTGCAGMLTGGDLIEDPKGPTGTLTFINNSPSTIVNVYITRCSNSTYGLRRNDKDIDPGEKYVFTVSPGCWTVRVGSNRDGKAEESYKVEAGKNIDLNFKYCDR